MKMAEGHAESQSLVHFLVVVRVWSAPIVERRPLKQPDMLLLSLHSVVEVENSWSLLIVSTSY